MQVAFGDKAVGENGSVFIIAEISANHGQCFDNAVEMIKDDKKGQTVRC